MGLFLCKTEYVARSLFNWQFSPPSLPPSLLPSILRLVVAPNAGILFLPPPVPCRAAAACSFWHSQSCSCCCCCSRTTNGPRGDSTPPHRPDITECRGHVQANNNCYNGVGEDSPRSAKLHKMSVDCSSANGIPTSRRLQRCIQLSNRTPPRQPNFAGSNHEQRPRPPMAEGELAGRFDQDDHQWFNVSYPSYYYRLGLLVFQSSITLHSVQPKCTSMLAICLDFGHPLMDVSLRVLKW